jgi:hypothetical protein
MQKKTKILITFTTAVLGFGGLSSSAQVLAHRYSFNDAAGSTTFADSVGGADGTLNNGTAGNPTSHRLMERNFNWTGLAVMRCCRPAW